jgi:colanic acid/amylovoran biosynthesis glycosyltransferase
VSDRKKLTIAYIVSMPHGLDAWTFREIDALAEDNTNIIIFPVRYATGPYMPKQAWECYRYSKWKVILRQVLWITKHPAIYVSLLLDSMSTHSIVDLFLAFDFARLMAKRRTEMIHCVFGDHKLFIGYYCKKILNIPLSVALYGYDLKANPNWPMFRRSIQSADTIIVNCEYNKHLLAEIAGSEVGQRAKVIRHYAHIQPSQRKERVSILIVGGFVERKGHRLLFRAVKTLGSEANNVEVWVAGYPGPVDVMNLARKVGVADKVRMFGCVSDQVLELLYQQCDIFCLPSKTDSHGVSEGLPVALIEAMANAKPVIATRIGGIPELVEETLIEEEDVVGLAKAIKCYIENPDLRQSSGMRNQKIVENKYSRNNVNLMKDLWLESLK